MNTKMIIALVLVFILLLLFNCNTKGKENVMLSKVDTINEVAEAEMAQNFNLDGYELMKQKCFICHFEQPDPSRINEMIAPPMLRVQEHYKPIYTDKKEFVKAVMDFVKNPSEDNTLMPGAIRRFNLMAKLPYEDADLELISETLYTMDFGIVPRRRLGAGMVNELRLNNGEKWQLSPETISDMNAVHKELEKFKSDHIADYQQLGRSLFDQAKVMLLDKAYTGDLFNQIHYFFYSIEGNMHLLIASKSIDEAEKQRDILNASFGRFNEYFEEKRDH